MAHQRVKRHQHRSRRQWCSHQRRRQPNQNRRHRHRAKNQHLQRRGQWLPLSSWLQSAFSCSCSSGVRERGAGATLLSRQPPHGWRTLRASPSLQSISGPCQGPRFRPAMRVANPCPLLSWSFVSFGSLDQHRLGCAVWLGGPLGTAVLPGVARAGFAPSPADHLD